MKVKDCMCNQVFSVMPDTKIKDVVDLMNEHHVGCVPVCDKTNTCCGIVTDRDILLRSVACDKDVKTTPISDIMTCNVETCKQDEEMSNAQSKMEQKQIRRLPVCDTNNKVVGILTFGDLTNHDNELGKVEVCETFEKVCHEQGENNS